MATGITTYADLYSAGVLNDIFDDAYFELRESNLLVATVRAASALGMAPRKTTTYNSSNVREAGEGDDITPTKLEKSLVRTITPTRFADSYLITDQDMASDPDGAMSAASYNLGVGMATYVDQAIGSLFGSLTGGTVGAAGSTMTWEYVANARARVQAANVRGPFYCVMHPYQWNDLFIEATINGNEFARAPQFQERALENYFISQAMGDVIFVVTSNLTVDANDDVTAALYSRDALIYDERKPFNIRPERDESREAMELNSSLWAAISLYRPELGIKIISDASTPS